MKKTIAFFFVLFSLQGFSQKYFAEIKNDTVQRVIVVESAILANQLFGGTWVETYIDSTGKNYAGIGFKYHADKKNFSAPKPFPSWTLDENCQWQPPTPMPTDGKPYYWKEETQTWEEIK